MARDDLEKSILEAAVVTCGPLEPGIEHVGWSTDGADGPHLIVMQDFSDPHGYCLVTGGQGTFYGGVERFSVVGTETRIAISPDAASALGTSRELRLRDLSRAVDPAQLRTTLSRFFGMEPTAG